MEARSKIKRHADADKRRESTAMKSFKGTVRPTTRTETPVQPGSRDPLSQKLTNLLTVVIPSIGRPSLKNAIESCLGQDLPSKHKMEVVVVDNTMTGELRELIDHYTNRDPRIRYVHQPCKGFSCARNTGVEQGLGTYVAFLDDDEEACSGWAAALLRQAHRGACAVFGPIRASFDAPLEYPEAERLFSRNLRCRDGSDVTRYRVNLGTGNSLFDRDVCFTSRPFFATELNHIGGEDSEFLMRLVDRGVRLIWAADALVVEHVPSHRVDPLRLCLASVPQRTSAIACLLQIGWASHTRGDCLDGSRRCPDCPIWTAFNRVPGLRSQTCVAFSAQGSRRAWQGAMDAVVLDVQLR